MNTFLPYQSYSKSASVLDGLRLNKQVTECEQMLQALIDPEYGWKSHPAVRMWRGHENELVKYGLTCYIEWQRRFQDGERGGKLNHKSGERLWKIYYELGEPLYLPESAPDWLTDEFCSRHRAVLLAKNYNHYSQFGWSEQPAEMVNGKWDYIWPVK